MTVCKHETLIYESSEHATEVGYKRATPRQRLAATLSPSTLPENYPVEDLRGSTFPAPLVLPGDDISCDPRYEGQDVDHTAIREATGRRNKLYVVPPPSISHEILYVRDWAQPQLGNVKKKRGKSRLKIAEEVVVPPPDVEDVKEYLAAFFHPMTTRILARPRLEFMPWDEITSVKSKRGRIGLNIGPEVVGVRYRPSGDGVYSGQLNLDDMLDAAIAILPADAFALVMLVDQDLYEDEEDDFCCGRAYGGSRVSIVSSARYHPLLDDLQGIEMEHAWPASHCQTYVEVCCEIGGTTIPPKAMSSTMGLVRVGIPQLSILRLRDARYCRAQRRRATTSVSLSRRRSKGLASNRRQ